MHRHSKVRRDFLTFSAAGAAVLLAPRMAFATVASDRRFVFIIQRGAADGLHLVPPVGDPDYVRQRQALAVEASIVTRLDDTFGLHPSLVEAAKMYRSGEALFVHAVSSRYRDRSHFDGQNVIETGGSGPYQVKDGWLNRLAGLMPAGKPLPMSFAPTVPIALRGAVEVSSYATSKLPEPGDELLARVSMLYRDDAQLHGLWSAAMQVRGMAGEARAGQDPASLGKLAASFLVRPDGPRIAMLETVGWDTHNQQAGRLDRLLRGFDGMLAGLRDGLGEQWQNTTVLVATEFGRTVAVNGTGGTDHGTGSAAMLFGGAVKGGRVLADWPGLAQASLFENRDLRPTASLESLIATAAAETFRLDPERVARALIEGGSSGRTWSGLVRA
ncbi:DUF1501 domain-containing protein [Uliginosibacterium sp. H3]|uniref:DUF1501 domain-containing protein n=1 Tax=Uliginosibacterium silvisoli TaxID=3114758 RepID=A0ABU6K376_9RHOO|nr:DUF1501 domain-containing protein [Uliginosibacterium sp. H3]